MFKLAPSILSADFSRLGEHVSLIEKGGADLIHVDVMDGHFVPNISFGASVMKSLNNKTELNYDVHLMIENPDKYIKDFVTDKTEYITVHQEACVHLHRTIQLIKSLGIKAGVSINPATPIGVLEDILADVDLVLVMSVNPGFGGQKFMPSALSKLKTLKEYSKIHGLNFELEVDGGINDITAPEAIKAGADILVVGNYLFSAEDMAQRVKEIKAL